MKWTPEKIAQLRKLRIGERYTARQCAVILGCSKNAVIGATGRYLTADERYECSKTRSVISGPRTNLPVDEAPSNDITIMNLKHDMCRWPFVDATGNTTFCGCGRTSVKVFKRGRDVMWLSPYCALHHKKAYR